MAKILIVFMIFTSILYVKFNDDDYDKRVITLGASLPQSGIMKEWGNAVYYGANAYFQYVNDNNLIHNGKRINFIAYDDKYEPDITIENARKLIVKDDVFSFFGFVGTPTVKKILPLMKEYNVPLIAPFTGASFLRTSNNNIVNFRSSYFKEIDNLVNYLYVKKGIKRFAVFYQNDDYGEEGYIALIKALEKKSLKLLGEGTYKRNTLSIKHAFNEIKDVKPEAVLMIGAYKANALFIKKAKNDKNFSNTIFCNISFGDANAMVKELNYDAKKILFSQVVPSYSDKDRYVVLEYKRLMRRYYPNIPLGFISLESFLAAKTVVAAINKIQGNLTRQKFVYELKHLPKNTLNDLIIEYKDKQLLEKTYLFTYEKNEFTEVKYEN